MKYNIEENRVKYYQCYSPNLRDFLENNGVYPSKPPFRNVVNGKLCWIFDKNDRLSELLTDWSANKNINMNTSRDVIRRVIDEIMD